MTAVIGMLNKNGVAIAADSAVTRRRSMNEKVTKNGNKMVRMSDVLPVSVMITGNADFIGNPWDVIVRKYRHERGYIIFPTVEDVVTDLIDYLVATESLWESEWEYRWTKNTLSSFMDSFINHLDFNATETDDAGKLKRPRLFVKESLKSLKGAQKVYASDNIGFSEYGIEEFKKYLDSYLRDLLLTNDPFEFWNFRISQGIMDHMEELSEELWKALYAYFTYLKGNGRTNLVFTGYGSEEIYPSLIAIDIREGFDSHINWGFVKKVNIDDETPSAICPFAQTDVIKALLTGASGEWLEIMDRNLESLYEPEEWLLWNDLEESPDENWQSDKPLKLSDFMPMPEKWEVQDTDKSELPKMSELPDTDISELLEIAEIADKDELPDMSDLATISHSNLTMRRRKAITKMLNENRYSWVKDMEDYDVRSMAELARILIELTGLNRILTFQQEGVGGDVDLAVITKTDGFTWLSRKSWYHHKDIGGHYGSFGV